LTEPFPSPSAELRERIVNTIRFLAVDAVEQAKSGHPGAPMGLAAAAFELWHRHLRFDPTDPAWPLRDRFVLSNGHASMLLYGLLHLFGYDVSLDQLEQFRQLGSKTAGHPEYGHAPGVETTTGPLGQGFGNGVGMALAARLARSRFARDGAGPGQHFVYVVCGDGDLMEGVSAEAGSIAGHLGLGNLVCIYDDNQITIDGGTELSFSEDVAARFAAQHWHVQKVDGLDHAGLGRALEAARAETGRPSMIVLRTTIGYGSPNLAGKSKTHGAPLGADEVRATKDALGWPQEPAFLVPDDVRAWLAKRVEAKRAERAAIDASFAGWRRAHPDLAAGWDACRARGVPDGLPASLAEGLADKKAATRKHSGEVIQRASKLLPWLIGGSADLAESNATHVKGGGDVGPAAGDGDRFAGRNLHYGIREHAMGSISNGIALDGTFLPYAATFLVFSDYMRPPIRLASLMRQRVVYVFTHDSIFLGEDGPTHQPIEHLDALRAIPGLTVFRPADGLETAWAWAWALERADGPVVLALTRQDLPPVARPAGFAPEQIWQGAYVARETGTRADVVLAATGSEVALACAAAEKLAAQGVAARVVSMPSLELFAAQPESVRNALLPADGTPIVAVEAARGESFWRWVGRDGLVYGIEGFGASAPAGALAEHFGFTPAARAARVLARVKA
jgi:transketolase